MKMMGMLEARGATGKNAWLGKNWVTRFIKYCADNFSDSGVGGKIIKRKPRAQGQLRAAVSPERIAKYLNRLYKLMADRKPRWVFIGTHAHAQTQTHGVFPYVSLFAVSRADAYHVFFS